MRLPLAAFVLGLGAVGLLFASTASRGEPLSVSQSSPVSDDSTGARLLVERQGEMLRVQGAYVNDSAEAGTLTYALDVRRTGDAGTSQSTQSGRFDTAPGQTDTLSTVRVNVQSGDEATLHLVIRRDETVVDEVRRRRTF